MNWRRLFWRSDERTANDVQLDRLEERAEANVRQSERVETEQRRLTLALKHTTKALRAERRR